MVGSRKPPTTLNVFLLNLIIKRPFHTRQPCLPVIKPAFKFPVLIYSGATCPGLFNESTELGPGELRFPAEQDPEVQCPPGAEATGRLQVPAANAQQGPGKSAQFLL